MTTAHDLLILIHRELEDRGGSLTRKTWCSLEEYVDQYADTDYLSDLQEEETGKK